MNIYGIIAISAGVFLTLGFIAFLFYKYYALNDYQQVLDDYREQLLDREQELDQKEMSIKTAYEFQGQEKLQLDMQAQNLIAILKNNEGILKSNQMYLYGIKEQMINMIDDYRKASKLMSKVLHGDDNYEKNMDHLMDMNLKIVALEDHFISNFKMTPQQYRQNRKINSTDFSLN